MTNPYPFVAGATLTAAELNSIGEWTDYTATHSNITFSSYTAKFATVNEMAIVLFDGTVSSVIGSIAIRLPTAALPSESLEPAECLGAAYALDLSATRGFMGYPVVEAANNWVRISRGGTNEPFGAWTNTVPFTWASGDPLRFSVLYRIAP